MNAGRDVEQLIATWLVEEAPTRAPDRILDGAHRTIERTTQRRFGAAWREPMIISISRLVAAAVFVVAAIIGAGLVGRSTAPLAPAPTPFVATSPPSDPTGSPATGTTRSEYIAAHDAICTAATAEAGPLKDTFGDLFGASLPPGRRAAALANLETYLAQLRAYTERLAALEAPADVAPAHVANVVQLRDMATLVNQIVALLNRGDTAAAEAVDAATDPLNQQLTTFEARFGLQNCP